ncbi:hypothetical protein LCGC14_2195990, partial [marine sediment metagenome]
MSISVNILRLHLSAANEFVVKLVSYTTYAILFALTFILLLNGG